jgi:transposase
VAASSGLPRKPRAEQSGRNHGALPAHLPRYEVVIDVENRDCPCCGNALHSIGELRTEQLDIVPSLLRVRVSQGDPLRHPPLARLSAVPR